MRTALQLFSLPIVPLALGAALSYRLLLDQLGASVTARDVPRC